MAGDEELVQWAKDQGATVRTGFHWSPDGVRGLMVEATCPPNTCLLSASSRMALPMPYTDSAFAAPWLLREVLRYRWQSGLEGAPSSTSAEVGTSSGGAGTEGVGGASGSRQAPRPCRPCCKRHAPLSQVPDAFVQALPGPHDLVTAYNWPDEALPLLACPELERLIRILKSRAARVFATGTRGSTCTGSGNSGSSHTCRGAPFKLSLAQAEKQAVCSCACHLSGQLGKGTGKSQEQGHTPEAGHDSGESSAKQARTQAVCAASQADVEWAAALICSRTFQSSVNNQMVMVPLMDMVNHTCADPSAYVQSDTEDEQLTESDSGSSSGAESDSGPGAAPAPLSAAASAAGAGAVESAGPGQQAQPSQAPPLGKWGASRRAVRRRQRQELGVSYRRRNAVYSRKHMKAGDLVLFTYHQGLRDDELLVYYGFLASEEEMQKGFAPNASSSSPSSSPASSRGSVGFAGPGPGARGGGPDAGGAEGGPLLLAVDHHEYRSERGDPEDGDLYDETGSVLRIDPLDGPWRGARRPFYGQGKALQREVQRLRELLTQHDQLCAALEGPGRPRPDFPHMPWLPGMLAEFRRRRRAALEHEIARLELMAKKAEMAAEAARTLAAALGKMSVGARR